MNARPTQHLINLLRGWPSYSLLPTDLLQQAATTVLSDPHRAQAALSYGLDAGDLRLRTALAGWLAQLYRQPNGAPASASGPSASASGSAPSASGVNRGGDAGITPHRLAITGGASQNLACILQEYADPSVTRAVWCVSPSYFLAFRMFDDNGFRGKLRPVPEDEEGVDVGVLRAEIEKLDKGVSRTQHEHLMQSLRERRLKTQRPWNKVYRHLIYCVPTHSNPSSRTMSLARRQALVRLARDTNALIICDDVYDALTWSDTSLDGQPVVREQASPPPRLVDVDRYLDGGAERDDGAADGFGNVASNGSFSKIAGPGLRTGWCEGTERFAFGLSQVGTSRSGGAASQITATFLAHLLETGTLQNHIATVLIPAYAHRHDLLHRAILDHLCPLGITFAVSVPIPSSAHHDAPATIRAGGYFLWLRLPVTLTRAGITAAQIARRCQEEENLLIAQGELFEVPPVSDDDEDGEGKGDGGDGNGNGNGNHFPDRFRLCFAWEDEENLVEGVRRLARVLQRLLAEVESGEVVEERWRGDSAVRGDVVLEHS